MYIDLKVETNYTTVRNRLFCPMANFYAIGCMSGSSLDGVDLCYVEFIGSVETDEWQHRILKAKTVPYSSEWRQKLRLARGLTGVQLIKLHIEYGHFIGKTVQDFIKSENINDLNFIASHGHTIFHDPTEGYTFQLGDGETSAIYLDRPFICNFRNKDVALKGQGAPLVPNGEKFLFREIDICINLGGIANIGASCIPGYDVCPCNYVSNKLANVFDPELEFDMDGKIARQGKILEDVLAHLEQLPFYTQVPPKSLGAEWIDDKVMPLMNVSNNNVTLSTSFFCFLFVFVFVFCFFCQTQLLIPILVSIPVFLTMIIVKIHVLEDITDTKYPRHTINGV